ncbi:MAG TPA: class I SAM-dependent methyltransferase, partial [Chitinophagaceae bacterium]|nr:class I SAM-dependent methyltransferase [Chitinophagaceae bacterium]
KILDFGCGAGKEVYFFRKMGYKAYGCDIDSFFDATQIKCNEERLIEPGEIIFKKIDMTDYRIPFADESFDYVFSNQVFEHVQNYPEALAEIYRVLKPGGYSVHFFPARYRPIEAHVFVPFAGIFRGRAYLSFWAFLGIRNSFQKGFGFKKTANTNYEYLKTRTTYFTKSQIRDKVNNQFRNVSFIEKYYIKNGYGRLRSFKNIPFMAALIRTFHTRAIFFKKLPG